MWNVFAIIYTPAFSLGKVACAAALGGREIHHGLQQFQIFLLAPHKDGTKQGRTCNHGTWSSGPHSRGCTPSRTSSKIFPGKFWSWLNHLSLNLSIWRSGSTFRALGISLLRTSSRRELFATPWTREVSRRGLFAKIPSLPLAPETTLFQPLLKIHYHTWDRNKDRFINWQLCSVWKLPLCDHNRVHRDNAELRLLYQSVYQYLCSTCRHSWIPPQGTWTSRPVAMSSRTLQHTLLGFLEIHNTSVCSELIFLGAW